MTSDDGEAVDGVLLESANALDASYRQPPATTTARRPDDGDLLRIAALYERAAGHGSRATGRPGGPLRTVADLRRTWGARRNDALIVELDGEGDEAAVVGYLEFHEQLDPWTPELDLYAEGRVDPGADGTGVGTFLLGRAVDRARKAAARHAPTPAVLRTTLVDPLPDTLRWLEARGMHVERHLLQLRVDLTSQMPVPTWPAGVRGVVAADVGLDAVHTALVASFADHHLGTTDDRALWERIMISTGRLDLATSLVALDEAGDVIGVALGRPGTDDDPGLGLISELGVVPAWRGKGLATALLRGMFGLFATLGEQRVGLAVDDVTLDGALRLYQRAGMEIVHHTVVLRIDL